MQHIIGSDEMTVTADEARPAGRRHAATLDTSATVCRGARAKFTWPALRWAAEADDACPECVAVLTAAAAVPDEAIPAQPLDPYPVAAAWSADEMAFTDLQDLAGA